MTQDLIERLTAAAREQGKDSVKLDVTRWLNANLGSIPFNAQVELLRILGVNVL